MSRERLVSLQTKFIAATVLVIALTMAALIGIVEHRQRAAIIEEMQRRGMVLVQSLAAVSSGPLLLYNFTALEQNVARFKAEADVAFVMGLDAEGRVAASSLDAADVGSAPADPVSARAVAAVVPLLQETTLAGTGESIYDVAVPIDIQGQKWGTARVGLSKRRMEARIAATRRELAVLAGLLASGMRDGYALAALALAAFVGGTIAQEFWRGVRARQRMHGEAAPLALARLVARNRRRYGGYIVHVGIVLMFAAFAGMAFKVDQEATLRPGESASVTSPFGHQLTFTHLGVSQYKAKNRIVSAATVQVTPLTGKPSWSAASSTVQVKSAGTGAVCP